MNDKKASMLEEIKKRIEEEIKKGKNRLK